MADKKDSTGSKDAAKPGATPSAGRKPKPLLDLKATEVRSSAATDDTKPANPSTLKGAPGWTPPKSDSGKTYGDDAKNATVGSAAASSSTDKAPSASGSTGSSSTTASSSAGSVPPSKPAGSASTSQTPSTSSASATSSASSALAAGASSTATGQSKPDDKIKNGGADANAGRAGSNGNGANHGGATAASGSAQPARRSGGGVLSTLSHLVAGVVGGGIALFAAQPLEKELGVALIPKPSLPADFVQRVAALEARPTGAGDASKQAIAALSQQVDATQKRLAKLETLEQQVASLAKDLKANSDKQSQATAKGDGGDPATSAAASKQVAQLQERLSKLESALTTLSSATAGNSGKPAGIAPLAQFSAKFADLESSLNAQVSSLRKSLMSELDSRISNTSNSTAKAVAGAERLDREVADIKTETARLEQRASVLKKASDKLTASLQAVSEQAAELKVELDGLKGQLKLELAKVTRPADVVKAIAPVSAKVASIEKNLSSVLASETARKKNAERIVLSLELSNLKRVLDRGLPYAAELTDVKRIAGDVVDLSALEVHKNKGVPTSQELTRMFSSVAYKIIGAEEQPDKSASRIDRLLAAARSIVKVRRTDLPAGAKTAEGAVAQIEKLLKAGDMAGALAAAEKLPEKSKAPAKDWLSKLAARADVDRAIAKIEDQLKASLGSGAGSATNKKG